MPVRLGSRLPHIKHTELNLQESMEPAQRLCQTLMHPGSHSLRNGDQRKNWSPWNTTGCVTVASWNRNVKYVDLADNCLLSHKIFSKLKNNFFHLCEVPRVVNFTETNGGAREQGEEE